MKQFEGGGVTGVPVVEQGPLLPAEFTVRTDSAPVLANLSAMSPPPQCDVHMYKYKNVKLTYLLILNYEMLY